MTKVEHIIVPYHITESYIKSHDYIFLFSWDYLCRGALGQCVNFIQDSPHPYPNCFPIATAYKWCANPVYFDDSYKPREFVDKCFLNIPIDSRPIIPCRRIEEGCSRLREFAPLLLRHIQ